MLLLALRLLASKVGCYLSSMSASILELFTEPSKQWVDSAFSGRVPGTQLLHGQEGGLLWEAALLYAKHLLCGEASGACGRCANCIQAEHLTHPDLRLSYPHLTAQSKKKDVGIDASTHGLFREFKKANEFPLLSAWQQHLSADKKSLLIPASEAHALTLWLSTKPMISSRKVIILWMPERLNHHAANQLLKTFEEPSAHVTIILISHDPERVLGTILSRCQQVFIPPAKQLSQWLVGSQNISHEQAALLEELSMASPGLALDYLSNREGLARPVASFVQLMRFAYKQDPVALLAWSDGMAAWTREELAAFLRLSGGLLSQLGRLKHGLDFRPVFEWFPDISFKAKGFTRLLNTEGMLLMHQQLSDAQTDIRRNLNAKVVLYDMALGIMKAF